MTRTAKIVVVAVLAVAVAAAVVGVVAVIAGHDGASGWQTHQTMMQGFRNPGPRGFDSGGRSGWWWPAVLLPWFSLALVAGLAAWLLVSRPSPRPSANGVPASTQAPASWEQFTQWHSQVHTHEAAPEAAAAPPASETTEEPAETGSETTKTD